MKSKKIFLYADGGSRGNPGPAGIGVVIKDSAKKNLKEVYKYIGETTNNIAEYSALISGLEELSAMNAEEIVICLDSELVVKQLCGEYKVKDAGIRPLFEKALGILRNFKTYDIKHIERSKNSEADKLVNKAINLSSLF